MKALHKDFWMEIRKSKARFISIFLIVALGVAFFSGIQAASPDMRFSGDAYYDEALLMDVKIMGTLGLTEADVEALRKMKDVENAEGAYSTDVMCGEAENQKVLHIESLNAQMNKLKPEEGRLPEKSGEIFLDKAYAHNMGYKLGDSIQLKQEDRELLLREDYKVCGIGTSPLYISFNRGNTTLGSGEISGFAYVLPKDFDREVYTQIYLRFHGAEDLTSYTDAYDHLIEKVQAKIEGIEKERCEIRFESVKKEGEEKLSQKEKEFLDGKNEAQKKLSDAEQELKNAEEQLLDGKKEFSDGTQQLEDAKKEIKNGNAQISKGKKELLKGKQQLADARQQLEKGKQELSSAKVQAEEGQKLLDAGKEKISAGWAEYHKNQEKAEKGKKALIAAKQQLSEGKKKIAEGKKALEQQQVDLNNRKDEVASGKAEIPAAREKLNIQKKVCEEGFAELEKGEAELLKGEAELASMKQRLSDMQDRYFAVSARISETQEQISVLKARYEEAVNGGTATEEELSGLLEQIRSLEANLEEMFREADGLQGQIQPLQGIVNETEAKLTASRETLEVKRRELEQAFAKIEEGLSQLDVMEQQLADAEVQIEKGQKEIDRGFALLKEEEAKIPEAEKEIEKNEKGLKEGQKKLEAAQKELSKGQDELDIKEQQLSDAWLQISAGEAEIAAGQEKIETSRKALAAGEAEIAQNEKKLADGKREIAENEKKLADAQKEIKKGEKDLEAGRKEYKDAKKDAEKEIADGEEKIKEAREEIEKLEKPEWIVTDRHDLPEYSDYGDNADRIRNIGQVFPVIFFLVAALISLTTMTRMVEDQRIQIGTLKALGYSKSSIMAKYINYALLATVGGSICGVVIGEKILPYIIINAYGIMYHNMASNLQIHYEFKFAVIASVAAVVCTLGATWFSCYRELAETPASLMRPPAPKEGKRILMERVTILWNRLGFSWKSTLRNLFRYKKRLFMTIFGIAGSMALMLVGFGIQDSIMDIAVRQYEELQHYDGTIINDEDGTEKDREELREFLNKNKEIVRFTDVQFTKMEVPRGKSNLSVYVYVPENMETFKKDVTFQNRRTKEKYELTDEGAVISEKTAGLTGLSEGDEIALKKNNKVYKVKIASITENYLGHYIYMTPKVYESVFQEIPDFQNILFTVKNKDCLEKVGKEILEFPAALSISYTSSLAGQLERMLSSLGTVIVVLIVSAGMLAFIVLYNLNNINITERQRELATLKVLGFYDGEVSQYVFRENILLTIIGVAVGAAFGIILHRYVITTVEVDAVMFGRNIRPVSFLYSGLFTWGFSVFVNMVMHFKLKKIDMVESLKSVE